MKKNTSKLWILAAGLLVAVVVGAGVYSSKKDLQGHFNDIDDIDYYTQVRTNPRYTQDCYPMIAFSLQHYAEDEEFTDIEDSDYAEEIEFLAQMGVLDGENNEFDRNDEITRAEYLKVIYLASGREIDEGSYDDEFEDVDDDHWAADLIASAVEEDIVNGYSNGTFKPDDEITYAQAVKIATRAVSCDFFEDELEDYGVENQDYNREWYEGYMDLAEDLDVWQASYPNTVLEREEAAKFVYDLMEYVLETIDIDMRVVEK